jgi:GH24 family phage-related lysozyme (muramidase)
MPVGTPVTQAQCDAWLAQDLAKVDAAIDRLGVALNDNQRGALESLLFNAGIGMIQGKAPKMTAALKRGDWAGAAHEFMDICHATDQNGNRVVDKGLQNRRRCEAALLLKPVEAKPVDADQVMALVGLTLDDMRRDMFSW